MIIFLTMLMSASVNLILPNTVKSIMENGTMNIDIFNEYFPFAFIETKFSKTVKLDNSKQIVYDKIRNIIIVYKLEELSKLEDYCVPKGIMGMVEQYRFTKTKEFLNFMGKGLDKS